MRRRFVALFLVIFGFILFIKFSIVDVKADGPTFRLISAERYSSFDRYTFSCSTKGYALGWAGEGNESYLVINGTIELKATSSMSSNNYTSFVITDSDLKLNSKIQTLEFTNVLLLNSSNLSGNPSYNINFSDATFTGFSFYSSSSSSDSSTHTEMVSQGFNFENIVQYIPLGVFIIVFLICFIFSFSSINKVSKEKVLTYKINKSAFNSTNIMFVICTITWFITSAITMFNYFEKNMALGIASLVGVFFLNAITTIILRSILKSKVNEKIKCINQLKVGMTREEIKNILDVELNDDNTIRIIKPYLNGSAKMNYTLSFDENNKLINMDSKSHKKWTETYYR